MLWDEWCSESLRRRTTGQVTVPLQVPLIGASEPPQLFLNHTSSYNSPKGRASHLRNLMSHAGPYSRDRARSQNAKASWGAGSTGNCKHFLGKKGRDQMAGAVESLLGWRTVTPPTFCNCDMGKLRTCPSVRLLSHQLGLLSRPRDMCGPAAVYCQQ